MQRLAHGLEAWCRWSRLVELENHHYPQFHGTGVDTQEEDGAAKVAELPKPVDTERVAPRLPPDLAPVRPRRPMVPPPLAATDLLP